MRVRRKARVHAHDDAASLPDVKPEEFEKAVYEDRCEDACRHLVQLLKALDNGAGASPDDDAVLIGAYTRWAAAVTSLLTSQSFRLTHEFYCHLASTHRTLTALFGCSAFGNADHLLNIVANQLERGDRCDRAGLMKLLLSYSLYSEADLDLTRFLAVSPDLGTYAYFAVMSGYVVLTKAAHERRQRLLALGPQLERLDMPFETLRLVAQIWFLCSYDDGRGKHDIKRHLNGLFRASLADIGVREPMLPKERRRNCRPTVLLPIERFQSPHALYRCFAPAIRQLRKRFRLVLLCESGQMDERSRKLFDRAIELEFTAGGFRLAVDAIVKLAPDMIYFPSVGMSTAMIALANLRLAPIQVATLGHPATTHADTVDYVVVEPQHLGDPYLFSETVLLLADGGQQFEMRHDAVPVEPDVRERADPVRIAVPSTMVKLRPGFMEVCRTIQELSRRDIEFHFFPSGSGLRFHHLRKRIREWLAKAKVYPSDEYHPFIENLNRCDLQLVSFPFGGTNSSIDALRQGIPLVTLEGDEVHSRVEAAMLRRIDMPHWLIAHSHEEYIAAALRLIHDDEERVALSRGILQADLDGLFFDWSYEKQPRDFAELFWWVYENHEAIRADGRKVWTSAARNEVSSSLPDEAAVLVGSR